MIGFILGTSEGKKILSLINKYTDKIAVSTATSYGGQLLQDYKIKDLNTRPLDKDELLMWLKKNDIKVLVDGSHPYAQEVTKNAIECAEKLDIAYIRYERPGVLESIDSDNIIRVRDYDEAIERFKELDGNILNTTGGNNAARFADIDFSHRIIHRVLPSVTVLSKLFDSGIEGGCAEKFKAAEALGIKLVVIEKPKFNYQLQFNEPESLIEYIAEVYSDVF